VSAESAQPGGNARHNISWRVRAGVAAAAALLLSPLAFSAAANATTTVGFTTTLTPAAVSSGSVTPFAATVTNTSSSTTIGSVNIVVPAGFLLRSLPAPTFATTVPAGATARVGPFGLVLRLRHLSLAPAASVIVDFSALAPVQKTPCSVANESWTVLARRTIDFDDEDLALVKTPVPIVGNQPPETVTNACSLTFSGEPADSQINTTISTVADTPTGAPVTVTVLDANSKPVGNDTDHLTLGIASGPGATLGGTATAAAVGGVATFAPTLNAVGTYMLSASDSTTAGITGATSNSFTEHLAAAATSCSGGCSTTATAPDGQSSGISGSGTGSLQVSIDAPAINCSDGALHAFDESTWSSTAVNSPTKTITIAFPDTQSHDPGAYQVCYSQSDAGFTDSHGNPVAMGGVADLPFCDDSDFDNDGLNPNEDDGPVLPPCVQNIADANGHITETLQVTANDPHSW